MSEATPSAIDRLSFENIAVSVSGLCRAVAWYRDVLGFRQVRSGEFSAVGARFAFLEGKGMSIELISTGKAPTPSSLVEPPHHLETVGMNNRGVAAPTILDEVGGRKPADVLDAGTDILDCPIGIQAAAIDGADQILGQGSKPRLALRQRLLGRSQGRDITGNAAIATEHAVLVDDRHAARR